MSIYKIEPLDVKTTQTFKCVRPFKIYQTGDESNAIIIELDLNNLTTDEEKEILSFANKISEIVGKEIKKEELTKIIHDRQIII